jgi:hypothetical protein
MQRRSSSAETSVKGEEASLRGMAPRTALDAEFADHSLLIRGRMQSHER